MNKNKYIDISKYAGGPYGWGAGITLKRADKNCKYVKTLKSCVDGYKTIQEIYPGVKNPIQHELVSLIKLGLMKKFTDADHVCHKSYVDCFGHKHEWDVYRKCWYKTTTKGVNLLKKLDVID